MKSTILWIPCLILASALTAQTYFPIIKEGIYYSHRTLKANIPDISFDSLLRHNYDLKVSSTGHTGRPHQVDQIQIKSNGHAYTEVNLDKVWVLCYNRTLFIRFENKLIRIDQSGPLCHFATEHLRFSKYSDKNQAPDQYILDFATGAIFEFNVEALKTIFKRDPYLLEKYSREYDPEMKTFVYLLEYNQRNSIP